MVFERGEIGRGDPSSCERVSDRRPEVPAADALHYPDHQRDPIRTRGTVVVQDARSRGAVLAGAMPA